MALTQQQFEELKKRLAIKPLNISEDIKSKESYLSRVGKEYSEAGEDIISEVERGAKAIEEQGIIGAIPELAETGLRTTGEIAGAAFAPITQAVSPIIKPFIEKIASIPMVKGGIEKVINWANKNPETAKDLEAVLNIAMLGIGTKAEPIAKEAIKSTAKVGGKVIETAGGISKETGKALYKISVPMEKATAKAVQTYQASKPTIFERIKGLFSDETKKGLEAPIIEAETAARTGLSGTEWQLGVQAKRATTKLWDKTINPALQASKQRNDMRTFLSDLKDRIIAETPDLSRRKVLLKAWESLKSDYGKVNFVSDTKLQSYKEGWAKFIPEKAYRGEPIAGALNEVRNMAAQEARAIIYKKLGEGIKQAYLDYGNLQSIIEAGIKSVDPLRSKSAFRQAWEFILDKTVTPITTYGGKTLYKTGEGLEFIGKEGAKKISDLLKN